MESERAPVEDTFCFNDDSIEGVDVKDVSSRGAGDVFFEKGHHADHQDVECWK